MFDMSKLGMEFHRLRTKQNETQREVGGAVGISQVYVDLIESGQRTPTIDVLTRLAEHFGVELVVELRRKSKAPTREDVEDREFIESMAAHIANLRDPIERTIILRTIANAAEREKMKAAAESPAPAKPAARRR